MSCPKKIFLGSFSLLIAVLSFFPQPLLASQPQYFDYGPYYSSPQVLGLSLSNLENLPALQLPENLKLPKTSGILPDSPFYPFERVIEGTQLALTFDPIKKESLRLEIASERLAEAKALMDQGKTGAASNALDDYSRTLTTIAENLPALPAGNPTTQTLLNKAEEVVAAQTAVTAALSLTAPPAQAENWTEAASATRDTLDKVAEVKGEPAIPDDLSTSLQGLKEQGLLSGEETNKLYSLKNRSQVRDELNKLTSSGLLPPSELMKLDEAMGRYYPEVQKQQITNFQVVELRSYQTLPQPPAEVVEELKRWQDNPVTPPSNDIKPYLWYNRAEKLAGEVDLSNFSSSQQNDLAKLYPRPVVENPTYSPPPSPSPAPTATPSGDDTGASPTPSAQPTSQPSPTPPPAQTYLQDPQGALPGQPTYILKQLGEGLSFTFTFDPAEKARLRMQYAERRLAEAEALSGDPKKSALYESTLANYRSSVADASNRIKGLKDTKEARRVAEALEAQAGRHEVVFEKGLLPPPSENTKLLSDVIKTTEDAMDRMADVLDRPALPPALASRLGDLKAQGLILPEEAEDLVNSSSREQVREKIRKLLELETFPLADAKKLDEAQTFSSPADYNQLVEVRKVEELQGLRAFQSELAQTPNLKNTATSLGQQEVILTGSIDPTVIKPEDLGGRDDMIKVYQELAAIPRPINGGQFGSEATPGAQVATPKPTDAVLSTCPEGAVFKQFEGCVWADSGKNLNDYNQYKCEGSRQYYSFAAKTCVVYDYEIGFHEDAKPICPVGYTWSWQTQSCQAFTGGGPLPLPSPSPDPKPKDDAEIAERSKSCPDGSSYQVPKGCVWEKNGKTVNDSTDYRCTNNQYYSFKELKCVPQPKPGEVDPKDFTPSCKDPSAYWSWSDGKCTLPKPIEGGTKEVNIPQPNFVPPGNPFYFLKQAAESVQLAVAFSPEAKEQARISQARERLAEGYWALEKNKKEAFNQALSGYTAEMQELYNDLSKSNLSAQTKKTISEDLTKEAVEQNLILQKIEVLAKDDVANTISAASSTVILAVDKAADLGGETPLPDQVKEKIAALPEQMISEEDKKKLLETDSRVEVRLKLGEVAAKGGLTTDDTAFLNEDFDNVDVNTKFKIGELKKLEEIATATAQKEKLEEKIEKNEGIVEKLSEFQKNFEPGKEIPSEIRPYVRLTRIEEVTQTIRPDIVRLEEFQNRQDIVLAVATLQQEFKPTKEAVQRVEEFRRRNPNVVLPPDLARAEALYYSLGVRKQAETCYLPTPPFPANTPCPPPGAAIPITSYYSPVDETGYFYGNTTPSTDKDGKPLVYGQGPKPAGAGVCPDGFHWMYDSGGWCMSNGGSYSSSSYQSTGSGGPGYTPYSSYYTAPGAPAAGSGYPGGNYYSAPSYYGTAPTNYTTNPPAGTVPGSGPRPSAPGQCPSGFHWMSDSGGWCMADAPTYVPAGTATTSTAPAGGYNCGSQSYDPVTKRCKDGACPGGFNWNGSQCVANPSYGGSNNYSPSSYEYGCTPGYYWNGSRCVAGSNEGSGWSDTAARSGSYCQPPSSGCGSNSYWDYSSCSCRGSTYSSGSSTTYSSGWNSRSGTCTPVSCSGSDWFDYGTCSCRPSSSSYTPSSGGSTSTGGSSGSCPSGYHWMSDNGGYCMSDAQRDAASSGSTTPSSGGSTSTGGSSGSCPSGYHWMDNSWCMQDGAGTTSTSTSTTSSPAPSSSPASTTESTPPPSSAPTTESAPPPTESAPPPSEPAPAPSP